MSSQMASKSAYADTSLDPETTYIRLLEIQDDDSDTIVCRFHRVCLEDAPRYTALSYTWGSTNEIRDVIVNGHFVPVRHNLWQFLQQAKREQKWRFMWIDALCIEQENLDERNHQVKLMRGIYSSAEIVAVWLGDAADDSNVAMRYLGRLGEASSTIRRPCTRKQGKAILTLCERKYWKRIWIVQEVLLAREVIIVCGRMSIPWKSFAALHEQLQDMRDFGRIAHTPFAEHVLQSPAIRIVSKKAAWKSLPVKAIGLPIEDTLEEFADMESTEMKDKVFALLGIIQPFPDGSKISVNYVKTTAQIYRDILRHVFLHNDRLDLPAKQHFKKVLRKSLGLGTMNIVEREPTTEARILLEVQELARKCILKLETQAIERFSSSDSKIDGFLHESIRRNLDRKAGWLRLKIGISDTVVQEVIEMTTVKEEAEEALKEFAAKERALAMKSGKRELSLRIQSHLSNAFESGVQQAMQWVQESRFEIESEKDRVIDSHMETRMMELLEGYIERSVRFRLQSTVDTAIQGARLVTTSKTLFEMQKLYDSAVSIPRGKDFLAAWICDWVRDEIEHQLSEEVIARVTHWIDGWYREQFRNVRSEMSLGTLVAKHFIGRRQPSSQIPDHQIHRAVALAFQDEQGLSLAVTECMQIWHKSTGTFDFSQPEFREEIEKTVREHLNWAYPKRGDFLAGDEVRTNL